MTQSRETSLAAPTEKRNYARESMSPTNRFNIISGGEHSSSRGATVCCSYLPFRVRNKNRSGGKLPFVAQNNKNSGGQRRSLEELNIFEKRRKTMSAQEEIQSRGKQIPFYRIRLIFDKFLERVLGKMCARVRVIEV